MNTPLIRWQFDFKYLLLIIVCLGILFTSFWDGLHELILRWDKEEEYSHGFVIPIITLYFIGQKKDYLKELKFEPSWFGGGLVLISLLVFMMGKISALSILIQFSFISALIGIAWSITGWTALKIILIPLLLLIFTIPLPYFLEINLSANLQLLSSKLGVEFIRWCSIPVYLEGNLIDLGIYKLEVAEACSGLRYLFPLMSLGFICAYMFQACFWKRALIFLTTLPITLFMNSFRIGVIGILVTTWGIDAAEGFLHDFEGWIIFMSCIFLLFIEMKLLVYFSKDSRSFSEVFGMQTYIHTDESKIIKQRKLSFPFIISIFLVVISVSIVTSIEKRDEVIPDRSIFKMFPVSIEEWKGKQEIMDADNVKVLELTDYIMSNYKREGENSVNFFAAYYKSQRKGEAPHSPKVCIPAGGWQITNIERTHFANKLPFNRLLIKKDQQQQLVYYWFQQRGRHFANEYLMKWYLFKDAIKLNRTDGAMVRLTTVISSDEQTIDADRRIQAFADKLIPRLENYIPN